MTPPDERCACGHIEAKHGERGAFTHACLWCEFGHCISFHPDDAQMDACECGHAMTWHRDCGQWDCGKCDCPAFRPAAVAGDPNAHLSVSQYRDLARSQQAVRAAADAKCVCGQRFARHGHGLIYCDDFRPADAVVVNVISEGPPKRSAVDILLNPPTLAPAAAVEALVPRPRDPRDAAMDDAVWKAADARARIAERRIVEVREEGRREERAAVVAAMRTLHRESRKASHEWIADSLQERGRVLTGEHAHWCMDWDQMTIDETCDEWPCACDVGTPFRGDHVTDPVPVAATCNDSGPRMERPLVGGALSPGNSAPAAAGHEAGTIFAPERRRPVVGDVVEYLNAIGEWVSCAVTWTRPAFDEFSAPGVLLSLADEGRTWRWPKD